VHGWQHRCQEDPVSLHSGGLEKTTRSSPHYVAQKSKPSNRIWNNTTLRSPKQQIGSEPPSVEDDVDVWHYAILELHARNDDDDIDPSCHPWCDSVAMWNVFSSIRVCVCVCLCVCLFVNTPTLEQFQILSWKFCGSKMWAKARMRLKVVAIRFMAARGWWPNLRCSTFASAW